MKEFKLSFFRYVSSIIYELLRQEVLRQCINRDKRRVQGIFRKNNIQSERFIDNKTIEISQRYYTLTLNKDVTKIKMNSRNPRAMGYTNEFLFNNNIKMKVLIKLYIFIKKSMNTNKK